MVQLPQRRATREVWYMDALLSNPFTYVVGVVVVLVLLIGLAVALERGQRRRYERLLADGEPAEATVLRAVDTGWRTNGRPHIRFDLEVRRPGHPPYQAATKLSIHRPWSPLPYGPGSVVPVRVDPQDPQQVAIAEPGQANSGWLGPLPAIARSSVTIIGGRAVETDQLPPEARQALSMAAALLGDTAATGGSAGAQTNTPLSPAERLRTLDQLRDEGLISAEEHARKRAQILGEL